VRLPDIVSFLHFLSNNCAIIAHDKGLWKVKI